MIMLYIPNLKYKKTFYFFCENLFIFDLFCKKKKILIYAHRRESFLITDALKGISREHLCSEIYFLMEQIF